MALRLTWCLSAVLWALALQALSQDLSLWDALDDETTKPTAPTPKRKPGRVPAGGDLDLLDLLDTNTKAPEKPKPKKPSGPDLDLLDLLDTNTKAPGKPKPKKPSGPAAGDLDLSDALDPNNDIGKDRNKKGDSKFSDNDLIDLADGGEYTPDKGKGGRGATADSTDDTSYDTTAETGTVAGIASAVVMALMGAIGSYVSYQKKKLCFSVQQSLNAEYLKAEGPESVVSQEPPVQQTLLQPPSAEPPSRL